MTVLLKKLTYTVKKSLRELDKKIHSLAYINYEKEINQNFLDVVEAPTRYEDASDAMLLMSLTLEDLLGKDWFREFEKLKKIYNRCTLILIFINIVVIYSFSSKVVELILELGGGVTAVILAALIPLSCNILWTAFMFYLVSVVREAWQYTSIPMGRNFRKYRNLIKNIAKAVLR